MPKTAPLYEASMSSGINSRTASGLRVLDHTNLSDPYVTGTMRAFHRDSSVVGFKTGQFTELQNADGPILVNDVAGAAPLEFTKEAGIATVSLAIDPSALSITPAGQLTVDFPPQDEVHTDAPLHVTRESENDVRIQLRHDVSLATNETGELSVVFPPAAEVNDLAATEPINVEKSGGIASITLLHDESLHTTDGHLGVIFPPPAEVTDLTAAEPINVEKSGRIASISLLHDASLHTTGGQLGVNFPPEPAVEFPLKRAENQTLGIAHDETLTVTPSGLGAVQTVYKEPLSADADGVGLTIDEATLALTPAGLTVNYDAPLAVSAPSEGNPAALTVKTAHPLGVGQSGELAILHDNTLVVDPTVGIGVDFEAPLGISPGGKLGLRCTEPMRLSEQGELGLNLHKSLEVEEGLLKTNLTNVIKTFGGLYSGSGIEMLDAIGVDPLEWIGEGVDMGELEEELGDTSVNVIRLKTSSQFSQKGSKLSLVSPGYERIPYFGLLYDTLSDKDFYYSETLQDLHVPHITLKETVSLTMSDASAVWKGYLSNFYVASQSPGGSAISIGPETNNKREIGVKVDGKTIRINSANNELQSGLVFQANNGGLKIENENNVKLAITAEKGLVFKNTNTISAEGLTASKGVKRVENDFQSSLNFTTGLKTSGDTVEVALTTDEDLSFSAGMLSCNIVGDQLTVFKTGNVLRAKPVTAGAGILVVDTGVAYVVSAVNPVTTSKSTDSENTPADLLKSDTTSPLGGSVVSTAGPLGAVASAFLPVSIPTFPILPVASASFVAAGGGAGALASVLPLATSIGGLAASGATVGAWSQIWGFPPLVIPERKQEEDEQGNPVTDAQGNPVYVMDEDGNPVYNQDEDGNVIIAKDPLTGAPLYGETPQNVALNLDENGCLRFRRDLPKCWVDFASEDPREICSIEMVAEYHREIVLPLIAEKADSSSLGSLATRSSLTYNELLDRPMLGALATKDSVEWNDVGSKPDLSVYQPLLNVGAGLTKTGSVLSIDAAQPNITSLGFLTDLSSGLHTISVADTNANWGGSCLNVYQLSGQTKWHTALTNAETPNTGSDWALWAHADNGNVWYKALEVARYNGGLSVYGPVTAAAPTAANHLTTKQYVDDQTITAGTGLTKTGNALAINGTQTQITQVGTLQNLAMTGILSMTGATSGYVVTSYQTGLTNNGFVGMQMGASGGARNNLSLGFVYSSSGSTSNYGFFGLGGAPKVKVNGLGDLYVESTTANAVHTPGGGSFGLNVQADRLYCTNGLKLLTGNADYDYTIAMRNSGDNLHVHMSGAEDPVTHRLYQWGYYTGSVLGTWNPKASIDTYNGNVRTEGTLTTNCGSGGSIHQVLANGGSQRWAFGLSGTESGTVDGSDFALWCFKNDGSAGPYYSPFSITRNEGRTNMHSARVYTHVHAAEAPTLGEHLANKTYVDAQQTQAGTGLTKTGNVLSVNANQTGITSVGTLTSLEVAGNVTSGAGVYTGPGDWFRVRGQSSGIRWEDFNAGLTMDSSYLRLTAGKHFMCNGSIHSDQNVYGYTMSCGSKITTNQIDCANGLWARGFYGRQGWDGDFQSNTMHLYWAGTGTQIWADNTHVGSIAAICDGRLKKDIRRMDADPPSLDKLDKLKPVRFRFKDSGIFVDTGKDQLGFLAEEVAPVIPEAVEGVVGAVRDNGEPIPVILQPMALIAFLTHCVQELRLEVELLKTKVQ